MIQIKIQQDVSGNQTELLKVLEALVQEISKHGHSCRAHSSDSLQKFSTLSYERQHQLIHQLEILLSLIQVKAEGERAREVEIPSHPEKQIVQRALDFYGLEIRDEFWSQVAPEDIVEIYSSDQIQIFRTLNFFKVTSYSLLDLLTNEWYLLWERPKIIIEKMMEAAQACLSGTRPGAFPLGLPDYILREIHHPNGEPLAQSRSYLVRHHLVCPVYRKDLPIIAGLMINSAGRLLEIGDDSVRLPVL